MIQLLREHGVLATELSPIGIPFAIDGELYTIESIGDDGTFYLIHYPR